VIGYIDGFWRFKCLMGALFVYRPLAMYYGSIQMNVVEEQGVGILRKKLISYQSSPYELHIYSLSRVFLILTLMKVT